MIKKNYLTTFSINIKYVPTHAIFTRAIFMHTAFVHIVFIGFFLWISLSIGVFLSPALAKQTGQNNSYSQAETNNINIFKSSASDEDNDLALAEQWEKAVNDDEYLTSMVHYGEILAEGRGVPKDIDRAFRFFRVAAEKGNADAQALLGQCYEEGKAVEADQKEAVKWYSRAAKYRQPLALLRLGKMFSEGRGVEKNKETAILLLYGALTQGQLTAIPILISLGKKMPTNGESLFGVRLTDTNKKSLHSAMLQKSIPILREDVNFLCNIYDVSKTLPHANELSACYSSDRQVDLAFLKLDFKTPRIEDARKVFASFHAQFGEPSASENKLSLLWNFKTLLVFGQYMPAEKQTSLIYYIYEHYTGF